MCEIHYLKCTSCGRRWEAHKKLASCEDFDPEARCPGSLVIQSFVGQSQFCPSLVQETDPQRGLPNLRPLLYLHVHVDAGPPASEQLPWWPPKPRQ
ncbi:hypothetical protein VSDG_03445 [Cytospora chrysosperma]|uniref:Uncharacterized protein n=1 Tax=Cytospora chrysosperma TaxID=252740 RepID=A0A423W9U1_CYTCH|nr:hypothetical protein VSDG_03445 [Valsa sordida]